MADPTAPNPPAEEAPKEEQSTSTVTTTDAAASSVKNWPAPYYYEKGLRRVKPYHYTYNTFCKERWRNRELVDIFISEFRDRPPEYYVRCPSFFFPLRVYKPMDWDDKLTEPAPSAHRRQSDCRQKSRGPTPRRQERRDHFAYPASP